MEGNEGRRSSSSSSSSSSPNLAQRFSRQLSRSILPALRNLVRSNRRNSSNRVVPDHRITELSSSQPLENPPLQQEQMHSPIVNNNLLLGEEHNNNNIEMEDLEPPVLEDSPASPGPLAGLNGLLDDDNGQSNNEDNADGTSPSNPRQRYRLVVYFEERSPEEQPTARYVAVIVGRLDELQFLLSSSGNNERGFGDILNHLFNAYAPKGTPPASKDSIENLPTVTVTEPDKSCMICLESFAIGSQAVVLPCQHSFHGEECVKTWLKLHNSCPVCRYELPVEDAEYETTRKERMLARGFHEAEDHAHHDHSGGDHEMAEVALAEENNAPGGGDL